MAPPKARPPSASGTGGTGGTDGQPVTAMGVNSEKKVIEGGAEKEEVSALSRKAYHCMYFRAG